MRIADVIQNIAILLGVAVTLFLLCVVFYYFVLFSNTYNIEDFKGGFEFDRVAIEELMDFIGMEEITRSSEFHTRTLVLFDTVVGVYSRPRAYYMYSLLESSNFDTFSISEGYWAYRIERGSIGNIGLASQFYYFKNGCIYFARGEDQVHKLCSDRTYETLLTGEERKQMIFPNKMLYHDGKLLIPTWTGIFIYDENTGELLFRYKLVPGEFEPLNHISIIDNKLIFALIKPGLESTLVCLNLDELKVEWEKLFKDKWITGGVNGGRFPHNSKDLFAFNIHHQRKIGLMNVNTQEVFFLDSLTALYGHQEFSYSNFFNFFEGKDFIGTRDGGYTARVSIETGEYKWKIPGLISFIYGNYVVTRVYKERLSGKGFSIDRVFIAALKSGEILKEIEFTIEEGRALGGLFKLKEQYILVGDTFYK